jgi:hypothetical protein
MDSSKGSYKYITITAIEEDFNSVNFYCLTNNYPNPFNPSTTIKYELPKTSFVKIIIYDILGREIEKLVNEEKAVGKYEVNFDASDLPSGIYFYKMQAGDFIETRKMVLLN